MVGDWEELTFAELVGGRENVIGGPFGSNLTSADYVPAGVPVVRGSNMGRMGRFLGDKFAYVSRAKAEHLAANQIAAGDLIVTQRGTLGQVSIAPEQGPRAYIVSQSQMGVTVRRANRLFVYYLLTSPEFAEFLNGAAIQTGVPHINLGLLRQWKVRVPPRSEQDEIARLLGSLDDKIELNRQIAATLEPMAQALFKSWFIDFAPVRAKAAGRPTGLSEDLAALFPDSLGDDELPRGWAQQTVGEIFEVRGGNTPSTGEPENWDGPHQWATPKDLSPLSFPVLLQTERQITVAGLSRSTSGLLPARSLLLSSRAPIGYMAFATRPVAINQGFAGLVARDVSTVYAWAWCAANMDVIKGNAGGSTFPEISKSVLRGLPMLRPAGSVLKAFEAAATPLIDRMIAVVEQSATITALRDTLLPRLISGELRIRDAEDMIAVA
jgi:type I restriction enzyme S subunit